MAKFLLLLTLAAVVAVSVQGFKSSRGHSSIVRVSIEPRMTYARSDRMARGDKSGLDPYEDARGPRDRDRAPFRGLKKIPLTQRSGARPLTKVEKKAKEQYEAQLNNVERVHTPSSRVPLSQLTIGQKMRGRIISIKDFGLFVDVGSKRDGLVHVKDVSKDYFISQLHTKFAPGQDVDVWVKFCEPKSYKLGLQMFPMTEASLARSKATLKASEVHRQALLPGGARPTPEEAEDGEGGYTMSATELAVNMATQDSGLEGLEDDFTPLEAYTIGNEVEGRVVRVSNFGVFVEFGAEIEGFLHKRKMSVSPKRRALKPWEINPIGADVKAWIVGIDSDRRRINLTTYPPDKWPEMLPRPPKMERSADGKTYVPALRAGEDEDEDEDEDRIAGLLRGDGADGLFSAEALEKQLDLVLGEDDEDDGEEDGTSSRRRTLEEYSDAEEDAVDAEEDTWEGSEREFDMRGEDLSAAEVKALMQASNRAAATSRAHSAKLVIDDLSSSGEALGGPGDGEGSTALEFDRRDRSPEAVAAFQAALAADREIAQAMEEGDELETEEIFQSILPRGATTVTAREVRKWDYVRGLIDDGDLDTDTLRDLVQKASGRGNSGKLSIEKFDLFIDLLVDFLGLEEAGSIDDTVEYYRQLRDTGAHNSADQQEESTDMVFEVLDPEATDEGDIEGLQDLNEEPGSDYVIVEEEEEEEGGGPESAALNEVQLGKEDEFVFTVETHASPRSSAPSPVHSAEEDDDEDIVLDLNDRDDDDIFGPLGTSEVANSVSGGGGLDDLVNAVDKPSKVDANNILQYVFASVTNNDPMGASLEHCLEWEFVRALLDKPDAHIREADVVEAFAACVTDSTSQGHLDLKCFNRFMTAMTTLEGKALTEQNKEVISNGYVDTEEDDLLEMELHNPAAAMTTAGTTATDIGARAGTLDEDEDEDEDEYGDLELGEDDELDDEEMTIEDAFSALSGGKNTVSKAQLLQWDVVDELMEAGQLTEQELTDLFDRAGAKGRNTLTIDGFETLLDLLSPLTDVFEDESADDAGSTGTLLAAARETSLTDGSSSSFSPRSANPAEEEDDEALLAKVFNSIANGKKRANTKDLLSWDFVLELMGEGLLTEELLQEKMISAGGTSKGIDVGHFDALVDTLVDLYGEEEEDEDEDTADAALRGVQSIPSDKEEDRHEDDHDDFEYDVDILEAFEELAGSSGEAVTLTFDQLMGWELLQQMLSSNMITPEDVEAMLVEAGVANTAEIGQADFEAFVDQLVERRRRRRRRRRRGGAVGAVTK